MRKSAGERAIVKEERRLEKERLRRIELANKMLIPVSKKTQESFGLISFDPEGVFRFEDGRWLKVYELKGEVYKLADIADKVSARIRITTKISNGKDAKYLSLIESGEIYEEVRQKLIKDETEISSVIEIRTLGINETMTIVASNFEKELRFSYASYVRGNKDWKDAVFEDFKENNTSLEYRGLYVETFSTILYPDTLRNGVIEDLRTMECPMYISVDLNALTMEEQIDYRRALEKKYNRRLQSSLYEDYLNMSVNIVIICDSNDAREIIEKTIISIFRAKEMTVIPSFAIQKRVAESALSLGIVDSKMMRNVSKVISKVLLGGENNADAKIKI